MVCDLLDLRCVFVNEIIGSALLAMFFLALIFFIAASKLKFGFDTTMIFGMVFLIVGAMAITSFSAIFAFISIIVGLLIASLFDKFIEGRT